MKLVRQGRTVLLRPDDVLVYRGKAIDREVLDAILSGKNKRLLWAFVANEAGDVQAVPYTEEECVWMQESDVTRPEEVEL